MNQNIITLDYGSGGSRTAELIESILLPAFQNDYHTQSKSNHTCVVCIHHIHPSSKTICVQCLT